MTLRANRNIFLSEPLKTKDLHLDESNEKSFASKNFSSMNLKAFFHPGWNEWEKVNKGLAFSAVELKNVKSDFWLIGNRKLFN